MDILGPMQTRERTPFGALVPALESAVQRLARGAIRAPERQVLPLPGGARYLVMPAADDRVAMSKLITVHPGRRDDGLPAINGQVFVADARSGQPLALLDGPTLTARRTAAMSMLGLMKFMPEPPRCVALVGTGAQAREHALALHQLFGARVDVAGRGHGSAQAFCAQLSALGVDAHPHESVAGALKTAQAVVTLTTSRVPVLPGSLPEQLPVVAVGAFLPEMAEVPAALVKSRCVVCDTVEGARHEAGDLIQAGVDWTTVRPLAACLGEDRPRRHVLFKTVGHAAWDLAAVEVALGLDG